VSNEDFKWLVIDSCGAVASLAIGHGKMLVATETVTGRAFSAEWPAALRRLLAITGWKVDEVQVVGVVHGPGSFTGVRVGLSAAKGLCEAVGARLIAVSRLEVLAAHGAPDALAVLDAGRDEFYVRDGGLEFLAGREEFLAASQQRRVVTPDDRVAEMCADAVLVHMSAISALPIVWKRWSEGRFDDVASVDANYVRSERDIYARKPAVGNGGK
jgi:tRNA threonylcarbamoyladenosine biosynthesis protein TsaB